MDINYSLWQNNEEEILNVYIQFFIDFKEERLLKNSVFSFFQNYGVLSLKKYKNDNIVLRRYQTMDFPLVKMIGDQEFLLLFKSNTGLYIGCRLNDGGIYRIDVELTEYYFINTNMELFYKCLFFVDNLLGVALLNQDLYLLLNNDKLTVTNEFMISRLRNIAKAFLYELDQYCINGKVKKTFWDEVLLYWTA